jgi:hypothetical protein
MVITGPCAPCACLQGVAGAQHRYVSPRPLLGLAKPLHGRRGERPNGLPAGTGEQGSEFKFEPGGPRPILANSSSFVLQPGARKGAKMAKIAKSEYAKIQQLTSVEGRKVAEVADLYGCTPANIYAILAKLRRTGGDSTGIPAAAPDQVPAPASSTPVGAKLNRRVTFPHPVWLA